MTTETETVDTLTLDLRTPAGLRAWRIAHGLTQGQLGELLEVTWTSVNRWENGHRKISRVVELALQWLELELRNGSGTPSVEQPLTPAERLIVDLNRECEDVAGASWFHTVHDARDIDAAAAGDRRAMIRLRKDCGLPAFKESHP